MWHLVLMSWEWVVAPASTAVVALAGIGATMRTAAQGRQHAVELATLNHRRERDERVRQDRLQVYADALAHAVDEQRDRDAVWASDGEHQYKLSREPAGAPLSLASTDEITVRMRLLADEDVEAAWAAFVRARDDLYFWADVERGAPDEEPDDAVLRALHDAIDRLKVVCRQSLERDEVPQT